MRIFSLIILAALIAGCGSPAPAPAASPVVIVVTATPQPASPAPPTATPEPAATAQPTVTAEPTATTAPSATREPTLPPATEAPAFERWQASDAIAAFKAAGLEAESLAAMGPKDYGAAPLVATEGTHFLIPSLCADCGGRVMSCATPEDLAALQAYYVNLGRASALFFSWVFVRDNLVVQINGDLPEAQARQYEAALGAMQ